MRGRLSFSQTRSRVELEIHADVLNHFLASFFQEANSALEWYERPAVEWGDGERLLACGAAAVADLRAAVKKELGFTCSAGPNIHTKAELKEKLTGSVMMSQQPALCNSLHHHYLSASSLVP